jgi:hypothetical protein
MSEIEREQIFRLLRAADRMEVRWRKRDARRNRGYVIRNYIWLFQVIPFGVACIAAIVRKFFSSPESVAWAGLSLLLLAYVATLVQPFIFAWSNRRVLVAAARSPIGLLFDNACAAARVDSLLLPHLLRRSVEQLEFVLLELKAERGFFERRLSLVVGAIEKVGLGPGLLAAGISLSNIKADQPEWVSALAYATPILYVFGVGAHFLLMRLDRFVKLTELAVGRKRSLSLRSVGPAA